MTPHDADIVTDLAGLDDATRRAAEVSAAQRRPVTIAYQRRGVWQVRTVTAHASQHHRSTATAHSASAWTRSATSRTVTDQPMT
ncbi:MAG TPA: hypothetical protein VFJ14_17875 [Nocardioidaceae bacterium]|nr:hypothetical protein [Nocardioidaceae bacterium]